MQGESGKRLVTAVLVAIATSAQAPAAPGDGLAFKKHVLASSSVELPVPADWVRLPGGEYTGVKAQFISVPDSAELSVFSIPFQCDMGPAVASQRAQELKAMLAPTVRWEDIRASSVLVDGQPAVSVRALWPVPEKPADVYALAVAVEGRTTVVFVMMAHTGDDAISRVADMIEERLLVLARPAQGSAFMSGTWRDGRGFSVEVPAPWRRILPEEVEAVASSAGREPAQPGEEETLGFVSPGIHRQSPNVILSMADAWMPVSEEMRQEFESRYRAMVGTRESPFTLDTTTIVEVAGRPSYLVQGRVDIVGATLEQSQYFVPVDEHSLILTVTMPAYLPPADPVHGQVRAMLDSVSISTPSDGPVAMGPVAPLDVDGVEDAPPALRKLLLLSALVLATALLVVMLTRIRRRR